MPTPTNRTPLRVARGTYSNLNGSLTDLQEGEIAFATDEGKLYVKQGAGLTSISASSQVAPTPANITASPAFVSGNGSQADPFVVTSTAVPFSGGTAESAQQITLTGTAGDFVIFTDNSVSASGTRFTGQAVGNTNSAGSFTFKLKYEDTPGTSVDNTTYNGLVQIGTTHFSFTVVQSNLTPLTLNTGTTISGSVGVGNALTAVEGTANGGTASISYATRWQRSFTGVDGWFNIGGATGTTYTQSNADAGYYVRAVTTATDSTPSGQGGPLTLEITSVSSNNIPTGAAPVINNVVLSEDNTSGARFTGKAFNSAVTMGNNGTPVSQKSVKGKVTATFDSFPSTTAITSETVSTSTSNIGYTTVGSSMTSSLTTSGSTNYSFQLVDPSTNQVRCFLIQANNSNSNDDLSENGSKDLIQYDTIKNNFYSTHTDPNVRSVKVNRRGTHLNLFSQRSDLYASSIAIGGTNGILQSNPQRTNKNVVSTDTYEWHINGNGSVTRYDVDSAGNTSNGISLTLSGMNASGGGPYAIETLSDRIFIIARSTTSSNLWYRELTDAQAASFSNGNYIYASGTLNNYSRGEIGSIIFHKGNVLIAQQGNMTKFTPGNTTPQPVGLPSPPSGYTYKWFAIWEDPFGNLIGRNNCYNTSWSASYYFYYSSNNLGATWVADVYPMKSSVDTEYPMPDNYLFGRRQQSFKDSSNQHKKYVTSIRSQTVTVTDGADLSSINVGDVVKKPGATNPVLFALINSISSNGNGTTDIVVNGFDDFATGDTVEASASTGSATATRFLVINASGAVTSTQNSDPGFVELGPGLSQTLTFPSTFPTGSAPDTELPTGTTFQVDIKATNSAASDTFSSNIITPT